MEVSTLLQYMLLASHIAAWASVPAGRKRWAAQALVLASIILTVSCIGAKFTLPWLPVAPLALTVDVLSVALLLPAALAILLALPLVDEGAKPVLLALYASLHGLSLASSISSFYMYWELMLLTSTLFIAMHDSKAALEYFVYTHAGSMLLLMSFGQLAYQGLYALPVVNPTSLIPVYLTLLGFVVKLGVFPFHTWLVRLYTRLSPLDTGVIASTVAPAGIYGVCRVLWGFMDANLALLLFVLGLVGCAAAMASSGFRELSAYASISHHAFTLGGVLVGAYTAATYLIIASSVTKLLYFMSLERLEAKVGSDTFRLLRLAYRVDAVGTWGLVLALLSLAEVPFLPLFPGGLEILVRAGYAGFTASLLAALLIYASVAYTSLPLYAILSPGSLPSPGASSAREPRTNTHVILLLIALCVLLGVTGGWIISSLGGL